MRVTKGCVVFPVKSLLPRVQLRKKYTLNDNKKIQCFIQNFTPYKIILYSLSHKFEFLNFRFHHFANIFANYARNIR